MAVVFALLLFAHDVVYDYELMVRREQAAERSWAGLMQQQPGYKFVYKLKKLVKAKKKASAELELPVASGEETMYRALPASKEEAAKLSSRASRGRKLSFSFFDK